MLWKQAIGAGWSGVAIVGDYAVTQEQRGPQELVVCYELRTGKVAWTHADDVRWDPAGSGALGGVGPRATPTIHDGKVFTQGATGIVNCLDARTGKLLWTHDTLVEHAAENIMWGKAGSPLIVDDRVVISVGGGVGASLIAYDCATGEQAWAAGDRRASYASPVLADLAGVRQIVAVNEDAVTGYRAEDGEVLWEHPWPGSSDTNASNSQPVPVGDDRVFLSKGYGEGAELIKVTAGSDGKFATTSVWKNKSVMRTKMGNVIVRDGHVYGLNEGILQCIDLKTGRSQWKKRRTPKFGHGQLIVVGDVILALSEPGEVILVEASPKKYRELASMPAIEGVTWNNPALAGAMLVVRNAEEIACFELPLSTSAGVAATQN
jgi:outer membrane protein assembly factor BamB